MYMFEHEKIWSKYEKKTIYKSRQIQKALNTICYKNVKIIPNEIANIFSEKKFNCGKN